MKKVLCVVLLGLLLITALPAGTVTAKGTECPTPKSLMLHSAFGEQRMIQLADALVSGGYTTMTYSQVYAMYDSGQCPAENVVLVSLDDLSGQWLRPAFVDMVNVFLSRGLTLTVGVVTGDDSAVQDPEIWNLFQKWDSAGVEIASHTAYHWNLPKLSGYWIGVELQKSHDLICAHLGKCPETLILPFGNGWNDERVLETSQGLYRSVVSIQAPTTFGGDSVFVFKRIPPNNESQWETLASLGRSFPWKEVAFYRPLLKQAEPVIYKIARFTGLLAQ